MFSKELIKIDSLYTTDGRLRPSHLQLALSVPSLDLSNVIYKALWHATKCHSQLLDIISCLDPSMAKEKAMTLMFCFVLFFYLERQEVCANPAPSALC